jgi:hypothetical protein
VKKTPLPLDNSIILLALVFSTTLAGCAMTFDATSLGVPAAMASPAAQPVVGDTFNVRSHATYLFWGLFPSRVPRLGRTLQGQLAGGRGVQNLRIHVSRRWSDMLITVLSGGIINPVSVTFAGVITPPSP